MKIKLFFLGINMKVKMLLIAVVLTVFAQGEIFASPLRDRQTETETQTAEKWKNKGIVLLSEQLFKCD